MVFLLIMVLAGVQAEARWNGAQRTQKVMIKSMAKSSEEQKRLRGREKEVS